MKHIKRKAVELWLKENQDIINGIGLDKRLGFPSGTIQKFLKYERRLSDRRITTLDRFLNKITIRQYGEKIDRNTNQE
ncbi:hypothetical protein AB832_01280 [Flavobacteriaceae bacterium (ex Bugula neritina AB1)]|nr:hypothetical protein AB832_01280 [Flavobacteriaceae bacterium (ex Bugula neritina AB1)]